MSTPDDFWASMYSDTFTACSGSSSTENYLNPIMIPRTAGDYALNTSGFAVTFAVGGTQNFVASSGHLVIDSVTSTTVTGGVTATYNSDNTIDGQFTLTVCP